MIGEHTDYNDGYVLPFAIDKAVVAAASIRPDGRFSITSRQLGHEEFDVTELVGGASLRYAAAAVWAARVSGITVPGMNLVVDSTIPIGAGLSSSAAFTCSIIMAAADLADTRLAPEAIALIAQKAETEGVGVPVGVMDPIAAMCCVEGHALLLDCRSLTIENIPFEAATPAADTAVIVVDTRAHRSLAGGEYAARRDTGRAAASALGVEALRDVSVEMLEERGVDLDPVQLRRARHVVTENLRVLEAAASMRLADSAGLGRLLTASHRSLALDYEVSTPELDAAVDAALDAGAFGARLTGGGFGGCVIAIAPTRHFHDIEDAVRRAFSDRGFEEPGFLRGIAGPGAVRVH